MTGSFTVVQDDEESFINRFFDVLLILREDSKFSKLPRGNFKTGH